MMLLELELVVDVLADEWKQTFSYENIQDDNSNVLTNDGERAGLPNPPACCHRALGYNGRRSPFS